MPTIHHNRGAVTIDKVLTSYRIHDCFFWVRAARPISSAVERETPKLSMLLWENYCAWVGVVEIEF